MQKTNSERVYLLYLLAKQDYSYAQLKQKLKLRGNLSLEQIESLLDEFIQNGWQSDLRYAHMVVSSCLNKHYGLLRIQQKLIYEKGVDPATLGKVLSLLEIDWVKEARLCYRKKYHDQPITDLKDKQKRIQYLLRQGYGLDLAVQTCNNLRQDIG